MDEKLESKILLEEQSISHRGLSKPSIPLKNPVPLECGQELGTYSATCGFGNLTHAHLCFPLLVCLLSQLLKMAVCHYLLFKTNSARESRGLD